MAKQHEEIPLEDVILENEFTICFECLHYHGDKTCEAFPDGIPADVWIGEFAHFIPHPDDAGIQYRAKN